jgi:hypothetical protein
VRIYPFLLPAILSFAACTKHDATPVTPVTAPVVYKDTAGIPPFISTPLAANRMQLTFPWYIQPAKVYLRKDTTVLGTYSAIPQPYFNFYFDIAYPFAAGETYSFVVETAPVNGVAIRYQLHNYKHKYIAPFTYQLLLPITRSLGPGEFDISPSRKFLFLTDDVNNVLITKRLSLADGHVDTIGGIPYGSLRVISDDELLIIGHAYNGHTFTGDTAALLRYNITTRQSVFLAYVSEGYGRVSRVIDNHVLITQPLFPGNSVLLNLTDTTKIIYPYPAVNFTLIGENNFDHLYYGNQVVNPVTGAFQSIIPTTDSAGIDISDSVSGYTIASWYSSIVNGPPPVAYYKSHLKVYLHGNAVYQSGDSANLSYQIPRQTALTDNRLVFYQGYGWDTTFHVSGYYRLDLNTRTTTLLHSYSTPYVIEDFQFDPHTMISVRTDGVYRVTLP